MTALIGAATVADKNARSDIRNDRMSGGVI
jgi:hypothetical protein